jgi:hypothetical protein
VYADELVAVSRTEGGQYVIDDREGTFYSFVAADGSVKPSTKILEMQLKWNNMEPSLKEV